MDENIDTTNITSDTILESLRKSINDLELSLNESLKLIILESSMTFSQIILIFIDFINKNNIIDHQLNNLLDDYTEKIIQLETYKIYTPDNIFMLLYISIMIYNDLSNPDIKNKIKLQQFIKMTNINNNTFSEDMIKHIYIDIYDYIKEKNIENNILHNKKIKNNKKKCIIL